MNYLLGMLSFIRPRQHHSMALWTREGWVWKEKHDILEPEVPSEVDLALLGWTCRRCWGRWVWWTGFYHPSLCQETTGGSPVMRPQEVLRIRVSWYLVKHHSSVHKRGRFTGSHNRDICQQVAAFTSSGWAWAAPQAPGGGEKSRWQNANSEGSV